MSVSQDGLDVESKALLSRVRVTDAVVQGCLAHAFTTEKEEIMGVLLGNVTVEQGVPPAGHAPNAGPAGAGTRTESKVACVWAAHIMQRSVRRSDRVEVAAEMLISASDAAEEMTAKTGVTTRVVGWYHSHPQITPYPSSVDLNSQKTYQQMESGWVGLIFSVYHTDSSNRNHCAIHCFQTGAEQRHIKVPVEVVPQQALQLPLSMESSEHAMLAMFGREIDAAVDGVKERTGNDAAAMEAARCLRKVQLFKLERLIAEPTVKHLEWCSIPLLEAEVARLEKELQQLS